LGKASDAGHKSGGIPLNAKDMLVKLYDLPDATETESALRAQGITIKQAMPHNMHRIVAYVKETFSEGWAGECSVSFSRNPPSCFVAVDGDTIVGFACYETTCLNFFGPTGVSPQYRGRGIGTVLLIKSLQAMHQMGYGYAIIGWVDEAQAFYERTLRAIPIPDSFPGVYRRAIGIEKIIAGRKP
jgi:GNAT superfamily N-acetyltransferase